MNKIAPLILSCLFILGPLLATSLQAGQKTLAERLGHPPDAKLLIIHADDLGLAHSVDAASFAALEHKAASSASVMVPCPWFAEVAAYAREHPDHDLGLHLTHTSEWKTYRGGPVAPKDLVPGMLDPSGYLWPDVPDVAKHTKAEEIEREIRAQV
ncbi:MAG: ChbG/HpnK family deacetylase, partial [Burkholderiales bacterium]